MYVLMDFCYVALAHLLLGGFLHHCTSIERGLTRSGMQWFVAAAKRMFSSFDRKFHSRHYQRERQGPTTNFAVVKPGKLLTRLKKVGIYLASPEDRPQTLRIATLTVVTIQTRIDSPRSHQIELNSLCSFNVSIHRAAKLDAGNTRDERRERSRRSR